MIPKFRAWDKISKKMFPVMMIDFAQPHVMIEEINGLLCERDFDEIELMQSTGLKDKNDKEIFDGDIVKFTITNGFNYVVDEYGAVSYEFGDFYVINGLAKYLISDIDTNEVEVIGNEFENPELLKGE